MVSSTQQEISPNTDAMFADSGTQQTGRIPEESGKAGSASPSTEAETLLKALRNVIIPLIRPADGEGHCDLNPNALGTEGKEFVSALEKFMTSFLRSQRGPVGGLEVELEEEEIDMFSADSRETSPDLVSPIDVADTALEAELAPDNSALEKITGQERLALMKEISYITGSWKWSGNRSGILHTETLEQRKSRLFDKALTAIREHVFNTMPIRLLCFELVQAKLQITLLERGDIFAHIASTLVDSVDFLDVCEEIDDMEDRLQADRIDETRLYVWPKDSVSASEEAERRVLEDLISEHTGYAILSHTWLRGASCEVTYGDWLRGDADPQQPGGHKLVHFCRTAWKDYGMSFGWMDTVCINKESSAELDESIRSMYKWYRNANVCITYLAETATLADMPQDTWFTRGWTMQELLAPRRIKFYNTNWDKLVESSKSDKGDADIRAKIKQATTITTGELEQHIFHIPVSRTMQMAATRQVTREEDRAYSLMGILGVSFATVYGEGAERAFARLLQAVLDQSGSHIADMFNWAGVRYSHFSSLLPSSPEGYLHRASGFNITGKPIEPVMLTHLGLRLAIVLMPAIAVEDPQQSRYDALGDYHAIADIMLQPEFLPYGLSTEVVGGGLKHYSVLDARISDGGVLNKEKRRPQLTLGVLNAADGQGESIKVPKYCFAVGLDLTFGYPKRIGTQAPITFTLNEMNSLTDSLTYYYSIKRSELETHGMKLVTMVL